MVRRPAYWEWRAELEASRARWALAAAGLGLLALALTGLLVGVAVRPQPIYYVTPPGGTAWPGQVPEAVLEAFAVRTVTLLGTLTPATAPRSYELAGRYLAPPLLARLNAQARQDLDTIAVQQLSTSFTPLETTIRRAGAAWAVVVRGQRQSWSRGQFLGQDPVRYVLEIAPGAASDLNPWGLTIQALRLEREGSSTGDSGRSVRTEATGG